jgi:hypothetical protein
MVRVATTPLVVLLLVLATTDAAVLVRFINTIPTRFAASASLSTVPGAAPQTGNYFRTVPTDQHQTIDRVGLTYQFDDGTTTSYSPTIVWTELRPETTLAVNYPWIFAMPPLRAYHTRLTATAETAATDSIVQFTATNNIGGVDPSCDDANNQAQLKADGVGLYLTFAAGTYKLGLYGSRGAALLTGNTDYTKFDMGDDRFTFVDGGVYTLIATGNAKFITGPSGAPGTGAYNAVAEVRLLNFKENVSSTKFGMASIRFIHAIQSQAANTVVITDKLTNVALPALAYNSASEYMDVLPQTSHAFDMFASNNLNTALIPSTENPSAGTFDIRQGVRATVICANTASDTAVVFCRMIPSRVVAYVRLINDNVGNTRAVQGPLGSTRISDVKLTLWASYGIPRPALLAEQSQFFGPSCVKATDIPLEQKGLYPVVVDVAAGEVSDYGEVHVPVFIMDFAVRPIIRELDCRGLPLGATTTFYTFPFSSAAGSTATTGGNSDSPQPTAGYASLGWFDLAPVFKRVSFVLKTDGFSTLSVATAAFPVGGVTTGSFNLVAEFMEVGEAYTLVSSASGATALAAAADSARQLTGHTRAYWRRDMSVTSVSTASSATAATTGTIRVVPLPGQTFTNLKLQVSGRTATWPTTPATGFTTNLFQAAATSAVGKPTWGPTTSTTEILALAPATYTYTVAEMGAVVADGASTCAVTIPAGSVTVVAGTHVDIISVNTLGCPTTAVKTIYKTPALFAFPATSCSVATPAPAMQALIASASSATPSLFVMLAAALIAAVAAMF